MSAESTRLKELDGLRGAAILWVLVSHYTDRFGEIYCFATPPIFQLPRGTLGVELFFMISGYVILMTLERSKNYGSFLFNRFSRLFPSMLVCVAATFCVVQLWGLPGRSATLPDAIVNLTFVPTVFGFSYVDGSYWSLHVEVVFYFLIGATYFLFGRVGTTRFMTTLMIAYLVIYGLNISWLQETFVLKKVLELRFIPLFLIGIACYQADTNKTVRSVLVLTACSCSFIQSGLVGVFLTSILAAIFGFAVCYGSSLLKSKPLLFLGFISYPLYLFHQNIGFVIIRSLQERVGTHGAILVAALVSILAAAALSQFVEQPALKSLRRWKAGIVGELLKSGPSVPPPGGDARRLGAFSSEAGQERH